MKFLFNEIINWNSIGPISKSWVLVEHHLALDWALGTNWEQYDLYDWPQLLETRNKIIVYPEIDTFNGVLNIIQFEFDSIGKYAEL